MRAIPRLPDCFLVGALALLGFASCASSATEKTSDAGKGSPKEAREQGLRIAQLELAKAEREAGGGAEKAESKLREAARELEEAREELAAFTGVEEVELAEARLALDRAAGSAHDAELELAELEAMYADEEFAAMTKELVLQRGRRQQELARRGLELQQRKIEQLQSLELPRRRAALETGVMQAEAALAEARHARELAALESEIAIAKAQDALRKAKEKKDE